MNLPKLPGKQSQKRTFVLIVLAVLGLSTLVPFVGSMVSGNVPIINYAWKSVLAFCALLGGYMIWNKDI